LIEKEEVIKKLPWFGGKKKEAKVVKCPECGGLDTKMYAAGLGIKRYSCNGCGKLWKS
jgi:ssDNA-binding Zn-finger/Zn-ribbon topoisomerase 1